MSVTVDDVKNGIIYYGDDAERGFISGSPLYGEPTDQIDIDVFLDEVFTSDAPYYLWGVHNVLAVDDETGKPDYYSIAAVAMHVEDSPDESEELLLNGSSKLDIELWPNGIRVYVDSDADVERVAPVLCDVFNEYDIEVLRSE